MWATLQFLRSSAKRLLERPARLLTSMGLGHPVGLAGSTVIAVVLSITVLESAGTRLFHAVRDDVMRPTGRAGVVHNYGDDSVRMARFVRGNPVLGTVPMLGSASSQDEVDQDTGGQLLARYVFTTTPEVEKTPEAEATSEDPDGPADETRDGGDESGDAEPAREPVNPEFLIVEVVREDADEGSSVRLDVALKTAEGFRRVPWWTHENLGDSPRLLSVERATPFSFLRRVSADATVTAFASYVRNQFQADVKRINSGEVENDGGSLRKADFKLLVADELERALESDWRHLGTATPVFLLKTVSGELQALTLVCLLVLGLTLFTRSTLFLGVRAVALVVLAVARRRLSEDGYAAFTTRLADWHVAFLGVESPLLRPLAHRLSNTTSANPDRTPEEQCRGSWEVVRQQAGVLTELAETLIWCGFMGTIFFLSLSLGAISLSESFPRMVAIVALVASLNAGAFLTTLASSVAHRFASWVNHLVLSAERRAEERDVRYVYGLDTLCRPVEFAEESREPTVTATERHFGRDPLGGLAGAGLWAYGRARDTLAAVWTCVREVSTGKRSVPWRIAGLSLGGLACILVWTGIAEAGTSDAGAGSEVPVLDRVGSALMLPMIGSSVLAGAVAFTLRIRCRRAEVQPEHVRRELECNTATGKFSGRRLAEYAEAKPCAVSSLVLATLPHRGNGHAEVSDVAQGRVDRILAEIEEPVQTFHFLARIGPLCGVLGTAVGMIRAFAAYGGSQPEIAEGIHEALVTTVAGLVVGAVALVGARYFQARIHRIELMLDEFKTLLVARLAKARRPRGPRNG